MAEEVATQKDFPLGPFVGHTTSSSVKLWVHWPSSEQSREINFSIHQNENSEALDSKKITLNPECLWSGVAEFSGLHANSEYYYQVTNGDGISLLEGDAVLSPSDLKFKTLPESEGVQKRLDFLLLSCHNPEAGKNKSNPKSDGFEVWSEIPKILDENPEIRGSSPKVGAVTVSASHSRLSL